MNVAITYNSLTMNNPLFSQRFRKGFTLVEIMIVLSIIGILINLVYPSYQNYLDRAHDTDVQMIAKEWITIIEQYRTDNDGEIPSQFDQEALASEYYCIG
jgi:type IV pilus assembly protein PilE